MAIKELTIYELKLENNEETITIGTFEKGSVDLKLLAPQFFEFIKLAYPDAEIDLKEKSKYAHKPKPESKIQIPLSQNKLKEIETKQKEIAKKPRKEPKDIVFLPPAGEKKDPVILNKELQEIKDYYQLGAETLLKLKQAIDSSKTSREAVRNFTSKVVMGEALATEIVDKLWKGDRE